jgi:regulator of protease activity HflC (stomatin/prohibitin superfamily)
MNTSQSASTERSISTPSGWLMLVVVLGLLVVTFICFVYNLSRDDVSVALALGCVFVFVVTMVLTKGFFTLQPNEACVLLLFGNYQGTERSPGYHWTNPFYTKHKISLRAHNLNSEKLKVNDKRGNPIEIGAVVVWRVRDTAQASFDVENYKSYVTIQSESALRHLASSYSYDHGDGQDEDEVNLRSGDAEVAEALKVELQERLGKAGVLVEEARIAHLAYAPEIAQAMLRVQQAEAVIAARKKIVHGAVSMVEMALNELASKQVVNLDDDRRAAMVSNLLVVLCGETEASPVINTGTLYH